MSVTLYDTILKMIPKLSAQELIDLGNEVSKLKSGKPKNIDNDIYKIVYDRLGIIFEEGYRIKIMPYPMFRKQNIKKQFDYFEKGCIALQSIIESSNFERVDKVRLIDLSIDLCIQNIKDSKSPLCLTTFAYFFSNVDAYIRKEFPDYLESGLLKLIFTK